jgi:DNA-binding NtrC family response regulator
MQAHIAITRRILVVGSGPANGRVIEDATQAWMFETIVCSSLREAEDFLAKQEFALIFCEDRFRGGTYPELLSVVRGSYKVPVVVMISDVEEESAFREAMELGAFGVLGSPCTAKDAQWMVIRAAQYGTNSSKSALSSRSASASASNGLQGSK